MCFPRYHPSFSRAAHGCKRSARNSLYTAVIGADPLSLLTPSRFRPVAQGRVRSFRPPTSTNRRLSMRPSAPTTPHHRDKTAGYANTRPERCQRKLQLTRTQLSEIGEFAWMHRMDQIGLIRCSIVASGRSGQQPPMANRERSSQGERGSSSNSYHPIILCIHANCSSGAKWVRVRNCNRQTPGSSSRNAPRRSGVRPVSFRSPPLYLHATNPTQRAWGAPSTPRTTTSAGGHRRELAGYQRPQPHHLRRRDRVVHGDAGRRTIAGRGRLTVHNAGHPPDGQRAAVDLHFVAWLMARLTGCSGSTSGAQIDACGCIVDTVPACCYGVPANCGAWPAQAAFGTAISPHKS